MPATLLMLMFLGGYVLGGCSRAGREDTNDVAQPAATDDSNPSATGEDNSAQSPETAALSPLSVDEAESFVKSFCGTGVLENFRKLDAKKYLLSSAMPRWLNADKEDGEGDSSTQADLIKNLTSSPIFNAMFPKGKMVLADFSSGNNCRNTLVAIDALAAAYLKKLKDASSANAITCSKRSKGGYHSLNFTVPSIEAKLKGATSNEPHGCDSTLALVMVGHSSGTLTVSSTSNDELLGEEPRLFDFTLSSSILEADGSAQFVRSDGALKFFYYDFTTIYSSQVREEGEDD